MEQSAGLGTRSGLEDIDAEGPEAFDRVAERLGRDRSLQDIRGPRAHGVDYRANAWHRRHDQDHRARITGSALAEQVQRGHVLGIEIQDDGVGFESDKAREFLKMGRVGLASMRERVELASGSLRVVSAPGRGTVVRAHIPLDPGPLHRVDHPAA